MSEHGPRPGRANRLFRTNPDYAKGGKYYKKGGRKANPLDRKRPYKRESLSPGKIRTRQRQASKKFPLAELLITNFLLSHPGTHNYWNVIRVLRHEYEKLEPQIVPKGKPNTLPRDVASGKLSQTMSRMRREGKLKMDYASRMIELTREFIAEREEAARRNASQEIPPPQL